MMNSPRKIDAAARAGEVPGPMRRRPSRAPASGATALLLLSAGLAGLLAAEVGWPASALSGPDAPIRPAPSPPAAPARPGAPIGPLLARPLFSATRRPPDVVGAAGPAAAAVSPPVLYGTVMIPGQPGLALLKLGDAARLQPAREGDRVGPFTVGRVAAGQVVADGPDGTLVLRMGPTRALPPEPAPVSSVSQRMPNGAPDQDE